MHRAVNWDVVVFIRQQRQDRAKRLNLLANPEDLKFFFADNLADVPHRRPPRVLGWQGAYKKRVPAGAKSANKKAAPLLGPPFKEAERREVREDFVRRRSDKQNDHSGVVENNELW
jgi:hypothetical protein